MPEWVRRAEEAQSRSEGSFSRGKQRVLVEQRISICKSEHWKWRAKGALHDVCGVCHPPGPGVGEYERIEGVPS